MQFKITTPVGVTIVIVALLLCVFVFWKSQSVTSDSTGGKGIPRTDGLTPMQKSGIDIMNRADRPDVTPATK
jgi:hypothetical protein